LEEERIKNPKIAETALNSMGDKEAFSRSMSIFYRVTLKDKFG